MKATYGGFEAKNTRGGSPLPPAGSFLVAEIKAVNIGKNYSGNEQIECAVDVTEGEWKDCFTNDFEDRRERYGDGSKFRGIFRLTPPVDGDEPWVKQKFESNLWCIEQSNANYHWDWDEKKLVGKKVGINIRATKYTGNDGNDYEGTEIGQFETVDDVRNGKCRVMKCRDSRKNKHKDESSGEGQATDVTGQVSVPFF